MALIVEDGTGLTTAESYLSVVDADAHHVLFGTAAASWSSLSTGQKEIALRKATRYIDASYSFRGERKRVEQALLWPRVGYGTDEVYEPSGSWPVPLLRQATAELAVKAAAGELLVDEDSRIVTEKTVGPITVKYGDTRFGGQKRYAIIDKLLSPLTVSVGSLGMRLERA